jgi:hypothetical protein
MDAPPTQHTLSDFVDDHYKLITSVAAFTALTVFFTQVDNNELKVYLPALTFLITIMFALELGAKFPPPPLHWRLKVVEYLFPLVLAMMSFYWVSKFLGVWAPLLFGLLEGGLFLAFAALIAGGLKWVTKQVYRKWLDRDVNELSGKWVSPSFLIFSALLIFGVLHLLQNRIVKPAAKVQTTAPSNCQNESGGCDSN